MLGGASFRINAGEFVPYQSGRYRRRNVQFGVGRSVWAGKPPLPIPEQVLDGIPGCMAWVALLFSITSAIAFPQALLLLAAALGLYSALRFCLAGAANIYGLRLIKAQGRIDWRARYNAENHPHALVWDTVQHVVIIPNYEEPIELLQRSLDNLAQSALAKQNMTIVLAMEAAEAVAIHKAEMLQSIYGKQFANFYFTVHPGGLPGETQCKSANLAWAARWIKRKLVEKSGYDIQHVVVTTMDADTMWHNRYFDALTYFFAVDPKRHARFWQAPIRYHSNIWEINPLVRLVNAYSAAFELAYLAAPWWTALPTSSYSLSLRLLDISEYWDSDAIADEWHMYIKAFFAQETDLSLEPIYLPFLAYATTGKTLWQAGVNRYLQTLRHAWGSKELGYMIIKLLEYPGRPPLKAFSLTLRVAHDILLSGAGWIIVTIGSALPLLLHPALLAEMLQPDWNHPAFAMLRVSFGVMLVLGIIFWYQDVRVRPARTRRATLRERLLTATSFLLLPVLTLLFLALPVVHAQTQLLAGVPLEFRVSRKL